MSSLRFTDEQLRAYLDDEADDVLRAEIDAALEVDADDALQTRLMALDDFAELVRPAFDLVLQNAPSEALVERLAAAERAAASYADDPKNPRRAREWAALAAGIAAVLTTGVFIGRGPLAPPAREVPVPGPTQIVEVEIEPAPRTWMMAVADYVALFNTDTFAETVVDAGELAGQIQRVSDAVGVDLALAADLSNLTLQRAELLQLNGLPLAQLAYTHEDGTPVAFCVIFRTGREPDGAPVSFRAASARDLNAVLWDVQPRGYLVIGDRPTAELESLAETLADRFI